MIEMFSFLPRILLLLAIFAVLVVTASKIGRVGKPAVLFACSVVLLLLVTVSTIITPMLIRPLVDPERVYVFILMLNAIYAVLKIGSLALACAAVFYGRGGKPAEEKDTFQPQNPDGGGQAFENPYRA
ncbi:MAG: hypothetical protein AAF483_18400 [Planctomycetota bacterium]